MTDPYIDKIITAAITIIVGAIVGGIIAFVKAKIKHLQEEKEKSSEELAVMRDAVKAVVHDCHHRQCKLLAKKDEITEDEFENADMLHKSYKALGMNGTGEKLYEQVKEKKIK